MNVMVMDLVRDMSKKWRYNDSGAMITAMCTVMKSTPTRTVLPKVMRTKWALYKRMKRRLGCQLEWIKGFRCGTASAFVVVGDGENLIVHFGLHPLHLLPQL